MEPWMAGLAVQALIQLAGLGVMVGIFATKQNRLGRDVESSDKLLAALTLAMATAVAKSEGVSIQVGDLEIRVRRLERSI